MSGTKYRVLEILISIAKFRMLLLQAIFNLTLFTPFFIVSFIFTESLNFCIGQLFQYKIYSACFQVFCVRSEEPKIHIPVGLF